MTNTVGRRMAMAGSLIPALDEWRECVGNRDAIMCRAEKRLEP